MLIQRAYQYKLYPTKEQIDLLINHCFVSNQVHNILINIQMKEFELNKNKLSLNPQLKIYSQETINNSKHYLKDSLIDDMVKDILKRRKLNFNTKVTQQTRILFKQDFRTKMKQINELRKEFYSKPKNKHKPFRLFKFKKSGILSNNSFQTTKEQYQLLDYIDNKGNISTKWKILKLFKQSIKIRWTRDLISENGTITIKQMNNEWFIIFNQKLELKETNKRKTKKCGIDINVDNISFSTNYQINHSLSNKNIIKNNKKLKKLERKQSKRILKAKKDKIKLGKNYLKTQIKINKIHIKNKNIKTYYLHSLVNETIQYLKDNNINQLNVEKLNVKNMVNKKKRNIHKNIVKDIISNSFSQYINILSYKCCSNEIIIKYVNPEYTSKTCHKCGYINNDLTSEKFWICSNCGKYLDRNINAAINISNKD